MTTPCTINPACQSYLNAVDLAGATSLHKQGFNGKGTYVFVVDSGIDLDIVNAHGMSNAINTDLSVATWSGLSDYPRATPADNHGSRVASIINAVAPEAQIVDVWVTRNAEAAKTLVSDILEGITHIRSVCRKIRSQDEDCGLVISMSMELGDAINEIETDLLENSIASLTDLGVDVVMAAGNCGSDCSCDQSCQKHVRGLNASDWVCTVGAVNCKYEVHHYSACGSPDVTGQETLCKPDVSCFAHYEGRLRFKESFLTRDLSRLLSRFSTKTDWGTSFSTPIVAGLFACLRTTEKGVPYTACSPNILRAELRNNATKLALTVPDHASRLGAGVVDSVAIGKTLSVVTASPTLAQ